MKNNKTIFTSKLQTYFRNNFWSIISVTVFLIAWELVATFRIVDPIFLGQPTKILPELLNLASDHVFLVRFVSSMAVLILGVFSALVLGVVIGLVAGTKEVVYKILKPFIYMIQTIPPIVFLPLIILWFGIDFRAEVIVVFLMAFVPIFINTFDGVRAVDQKLIEMAASFKLSYVTKVTKIYLLGALSFVFSGLRIAISRALIAIFVAEFAGLGTGIGYLVLFYGSTFQVNKLMAIILALIIFVLVIIKLVDIIEKQVVIN